MTQNRTGISILQSRAAWVDAILGPTIHPAVSKSKLPGRKA